MVQPVPIALEMDRFNNRQAVKRQNKTTVNKRWITPFDKKFAQASIGRIPGFSSAIQAIEIQS